MDSARRYTVVFFSLMLVVLVLVLLSGTVSAAWWNPVSWIIGGIELVAGVIKVLYNIVKMVVELTAEGVMNFIASIVKKALDIFFDVMKTLLTKNPTVYCPVGAVGCEQDTIVADIVPTIMTIIQPFYVTMAIFTGMYYIFAAMEPKRRMAAKNMLLKLLVGMVICGLALPIFQLILDISSALTDEIFRVGYNQFASQSNTSIAVFAVVIVVAIIARPELIVIGLLAGAYIVIAVLLVMAVRYVAVLILAVLFPAALFLYFFDSTKNLGAKLVYQTIAWIFVPVVQAFMIVITFFALENIVTGVAIRDPNAMEGYMGGIKGVSPLTPVLMFFMVLGGLAGIIIAPLIMMQFMKWAGGAIAGYGMLKIPQAQTKEEFWKAAGLTALGGTMMGGLSRGMQFGMTQAAYMSQYFSPTFGDAASWGEVMPTFGDLRRWFGGGSGAGAASRGVYGGGASAPWTGAAARAGGGRGLVRDFFETYRDALTHDTRKSAELLDRYGSGQRLGGGLADFKSSVSERGMPLSTATTLEGSGRGMGGQYTTIHDDSYGARSVYLPKIEGPPFLSIPLYFLGGQWGKSLGRASKAFKQGEYAKGVGISLFETFKMFSPFRPVRHLGRILYTAIPEFVPSFIPFPVPFIGWTLRDFAWWGSRRMMGVGLGQMASRGGWAMSLAAAEGDFNSAAKRLRNAEKTGKPEVAGDAILKMDDAAKKYAEILDKIREGGEIRRMKDPNYYNKKLYQLSRYNRELHSGVMKHLRTDIESRGDVINVVKKVADAGGYRDKLGATLKKELDAIKYPDDTAREIREKEDKIKQNDMTLLLFDYIKEKHGTEKEVDGKTVKIVDEHAVNSFVKSTDKGVSDFMDYNAAMKFGVGVSKWGFDREASEKGKVGVWSKNSFDLNAMEEYIKRHKETGVPLVKEKEGEFKMNAHRLLYGAAYGCAAQHEFIRTPDGRKMPNIFIFDTTTSGMVESARLKKEQAGLIEKYRKPDGSIDLPEEIKLKAADLEKRAEMARKKDNVYAFVNQDGSTYVEIMRNHYATGGSLQPIRGEKDERTQQYLDAIGSGFKEGYSYRQTVDGFAVHYEDERGAFIASSMKRDEALLTSKEALEKLGNDNKTAGDLKKVEEYYKEAQHALGEYGLSESEKARREGEAKDAGDKLDNARLDAFKEVRRLDLEGYNRDLVGVLLSRYRGAYLSEEAVNKLREGYSDEQIRQLGVDSNITKEMADYLIESKYTDKVVSGYADDLKKANHAIYFSGEMVSHLRHRGYSDFDIDHLKLVLYQNPRYGELIERGETVDIRIADNPNNPNAAWINTERRQLFINVGAPAYGPEDHESTPEHASKFMQHLQDGDILAHEATHDRIREHYGEAGYEEIWDNFVSKDNRMKNVFDESRLWEVKGKIAEALGISVSELENDKTVRRKLRERGLTKEDLGNILCEGLADVGASVKAREGKADQEVYNDSIKTFVESETSRISTMASEERNANIAPGSWESDISKDDVLRLARMNSLAEQTEGYVDKEEERAELGERIHRAETELAGRMMEDFKTKVDIYNAIHSHAKMV